MPDKTALISEKSWVPLGVAFAAVLLAGGMVATYVSTESEASSERQRTNESLTAVVDSLDQAGLETIPHRLANIEARIEEIRIEGFTKNEARIMLWRLKDAGVPIVDPDDMIRSK